MIERQESEFDPQDLLQEVKLLRMEIDINNDERYKKKKEQLLGRAPHSLKSAVQAASEKGASSWVTALPSYENNSVLHKSDFVDAMYIRYGWTLPGLPTRCKCDNADFIL